MVRRLMFGFSSLCLAVVAVILGGAHAHAVPWGISFPVVGNTNYSDTFMAYRAGQVDNKHHAIDIFAPKHTPIVSPIDGWIRYVGYPQDSWGWYIILVDYDGYEYHFIHINNDTPGTDDGNGGPMHAYNYDMIGDWNDMNKARRVWKGQKIGYLGDSGNAENTPPHLHFEIIKPEYKDMNYRDIPLEGFENPYPWLNQAVHYSAPQPNPEQRGELLPYGNKITAEVNVARGNLDQDPAFEMVTAAGTGGGPHIKLYDKDNNYLNKQFMAYDPYFEGGVDVAIGDVDGDGIGEIVTGAGPTGGPHIKVFKTDGKTVISQFMAYDPYFDGGTRVAVADIDKDGKAEVITGVVSRGGPHVKVFKVENGKAKMINQFMAYDPYFEGGIDLSVGDVIGDDGVEIVTAAGPNGGPHIRVFDTKGKPLTSFYAYDDAFSGGVRLSVGEVMSSNEKQEIATLPRSAGGPHMKVFTPTGKLLSQRMYLEVWWEGGYDVAAGDGTVMTGTGGNRRASVREFGF